MMTTATAGFSPVVRLGPNPGKGRDLVVGDVHGHFPTLRHALAELEVGPADRLFSLGDLIDRGPDSAQALSWIVGTDPSARFDLVIRGNHEQLMLDALAPGISAAYEPLWPTDRDLWYGNGGNWWNAPRPGRPRTGGLDGGARRPALRGAHRDAARPGRPGACLPRPPVLGGAGGGARRRRARQPPGVHAGALEPHMAPVHAGGDRRERPGICRAGRRRARRGDRPHARERVLSGTGTSSTSTPASSARICASSPSRASTRRRSRPGPSTEVDADR